MMDIEANDIAVRFGRTAVLEGVRFTFKVDTRTVTFTVSWDTLADAIDKIIDFARHCSDQRREPGDDLGSQICDKWRTAVRR